ncbi:hypothetical protein FDP41_001118 [Naegleria fowleri]|uniref:EF-hand domain-containing protein n=1 Tax=Naegleria fowleri TaxID=5763 RepID=A0A6A5C378_NAEFO|nr:uncharacterized protein FDP41_001118 [Naegleria fowleri]KAF0979965.1 hypothetical protein FDP41_001118 [Naegleria fowleri]CAG4719262.1 unnamed protein product [Naegleria fowleri]
MNHHSSSYWYLPSAWKNRYVLPFVQNLQAQEKDSDILNNPSLSEKEKQQQLSARKLDRKQQKRLRAIFNKFASAKDSTGEPVMTPEDFVKSLTQRNIPFTEKEQELQQRAQITSSNLDLLFRVADTGHTGKITFPEYVFLFKMLTTPESEFHLLFKMFDLDKDGAISKEEFKKVMRTNNQRGVEFDFDCDLMHRFFGRDGTGNLSFNQFSQFMKLLNEEIRKQEFQKLDSQGRGFISGADFANLITQYSVSLPQRVKENMKRIPENSKITYAEFDAYNRVISNLSSIAQSIRGLASREGDVITKESFSTAARRVTGIVLSPMEIDIIFNMFASKPEEGVLYKPDYEEFIRVMDENNARRQHILDSWSRDTVAPDGLHEMTFGERFLNGAVKVATKTLYGGISGAIGAFAVFPIDMVKTRMQNQRRMLNQGGTPPKNQIIYKNSLDCFKQIYQYEGIRGFYRGLIPQLIGVSPEKAIKLVTNDTLRDLFGKEGDEIYFPLEVLAGCGAGASQVVFTNPIEIVKIRLQVQGELARTEGIAPKGAIQICRELGFAGLYKGASACFARDIPFSGIYFPLYAFLKEYFREEGATETSNGRLFIAGSIAGGISAASTTPFDVIKTRLQVEARAGQTQYRGIVHCAKTIFKEEGVTAFFKGTVPRILRSSPQFGVTLLAYEALHRFVSPEHSKKEEKEQIKSLPASVPVDEQDLENLRQLFYLRTQGISQLFGGEKK